MLSKWKLSGIIPISFYGLNFKMFSRCDDGIADSFYYNQKFQEEPDLKLFIELSKKSTTILDIGANTGLYSIAASKANPEAKIYAFEPYYYNFKRLEKNIHLNGCKNVLMYEQAVGDSTNQVEFFIPDKERVIDVSSVNSDFSKSFYQDDIKWKPVQVSQTTMDIFQKESLAGKPIDLMKIDVESYEMNVFKGCGQLFKIHKPIIIFETFPDDKRIEYFNSIISGYDYYAYMILKEVLLRLDDGMQPNHDGLNFLFSGKRTNKVFTSFKEINILIDELI
jgi:FkbM family methyltransferase